MALNLRRLTLERIIIHDVPRRVRGRQIAPLFSEVESPLEGPEGDALRVFFRDRIVEATNSRYAFDVVFDPDTSSPVPDLVGRWLTGEELNFVSMSKALAQHLFDSQTGISPSGLVTVIDCRLGQSPGLAVLKLEREEGVRLEQAEVQGRPTFNMELIRNLMFSKRTRLFKLGLFILKDDEIIGAACDNQRGYFEQSEVADFFLSKFLGCMLAEAPSVTTKHFFEALTEYINVKIDDPVQRSESMTHLVSELRNQARTISPQDYVQLHFPPEHRQPVLEHLASKRVAPQAFRKDLTQVNSHLEKYVLEFSSGIMVLANRDVYQERIRVSQTEDGLTRAEITDQLKRIRMR